MNKTSKIVLVTGAVLATGALTVNAFAGNGPCGHHKAKMGYGMGYGMGGMGHRSPEAKLERMTKRLDLSDQQQQQIKAVFGKDSEKKAELRQKMIDNRTAVHSLDPRSPDYLTQHAELATTQADLMQQMMQLRASHKVEVAAVLTDDQYAEWQEMRKKFGKHGGRFPGKGGPNAVLPDSANAS